MEKSNENGKMMRQYCWSMTYEENRRKTCLVGEAGKRKVMKRNGFLIITR